MTSLSSINMVFPSDNLINKNTLLVLTVVGVVWIQPLTSD
jgi:hypothetical protein